MWLVLVAALACLPVAFKWPFGVARGLTDMPSQLNGFVQQALLTANDGAGSDQFGKAVALSGDTVLVGAPGDNVGLNADQGSAYVFRRTGGAWAQEAQLLAPDGQAGDVLGQSVALEGDVAVVGSSINTKPAGFNGSVYVFRRTGTSWAFEQKLTPNDPQANDWFGNSVAISGDTIIVGARMKNITPNAAQGAAYVFRRAGGVWTQETRLTAGDGAAADEFGAAVALSSNTAVVGATGKNAQRGAAYVFTRSGSVWSIEQQLTNATLDPGDHFGHAIALSGETTIIGAPQGLVSDQGTAFVFTRSGTVWSEQAQLTANDGSNGDSFGNAIALVGDTALIGAPLDDIDLNSDQGSAYVFVRAGVNWTQQEKLTITNGAANDWAGTSVALSPQSAVLGIWFRDINSNIDQGAAYVFDVTCPDIFISPATLPAGMPNVAYSQNLTASGGIGPYSFTLASGVLPSGLTLSSAGLLSGTTTETGNFDFTVKATDSQNCFNLRAYTLVIGSCPQITLNPLVLAPAPIGQVYIRTVVGSGGTGPYSHSKIGGTLPPGIEYSGGGVLNGTPTAYGSYTFTLRARDQNGCSGTHTYTLTITCPSIVINPEFLPQGILGQSYQQTLSVSGGTGPYSFVVSGGTLPTGLSLTPEGVLSGTPSETGTFNFGIRVTDATGCSSARYYSVPVCPAASLAPTSQSFTPNGGTGSVTVTSPGDCPWVATSNADWVTITSGTPGSGNGVVNYTVGVNNGPPRSATLTIAGQNFLVLQGTTFLDVPESNPLYEFISKLSARGITLGCGGGNFCPNANVTREQMAIFIERALGVFTPPAGPATPTFADVPNSGATDFSYEFIEDFVARGITAGCAAGPPRLYCPTANVTREQIAIFIERALGVFTPPAGPATPTFADVPNSGATDFSYEFIEDFVARGITQGCAAGPPRLFCPSSPVTRAQMAVFLVRAFNL
jgi:hypothetical protein